MKAIADDLKASEGTVRRMITGLALAHAIEAGEHDDKFGPDDRFGPDVTEIVLSETKAQVA